MWIGTTYADPFHSINEASARALGLNGIGFANSVAIFDIDVPADHWRWGIYDLTMQRVTEAGMTATVKVMQSSDQIHRNEEGVWRWSATYPKNGGWHIAGQCADDAPHKLCSDDDVKSCAKHPDKVALAANPPMPDAAWWFARGVYIADRYGEIARENQPHGCPEFIITNEWDESLFSPYIRCANLGLNGWTSAKAWEAYERIRASFASGVRQVCRDARFVGPETAYISGFQQALHDENERNGIAYNTLSFHAYAQVIGKPYPEGTLERLRNEYAPARSKYRGNALYNDRGRITELDGGATDEERAKLVDGLRGIHAQFPWIDGVNLFAMEQYLFAEWPVRDGDQFPQLTPLGGMLRNYIKFELKREQADLSEVIGMLKMATGMLEFFQGKKS